MEFFQNILIESGTVFYDVSFFLLFGLFVAGLIKVLVPPDLLIKHLSKKNYKTVLKASLIGVPLPLCSCSVLPTAVALKKQGASNGATISFLISTPEIGVDSISVTYALLDPFFTIIRPISAFITAFAAGSAVNFFDKRDDQKSKSLKKSDEKRHSSPKTDIKKKYSWRTVFSRKGFKETCHYGFGDILPEIAGWLVVGILFAGLISAVLPADFFTKYINNTFLSMLLMLAIGIPLYVCATGSTPIAAALIAKGLNPGAALIFLLVGPATNIGSLFILRKYFKKRDLVVYLASLIIVSLIIGLIISLLYTGGIASIKAPLDGGRTGLPSWIKIISTTVLAYLLLMIFYEAGVHKRFLSCCEKILMRLGFKPKVFAAFLIIFLVLLYLASGFFSVLVGETAIVRSFGKIVKITREPGLYYSLPYPFSKVIKQNNEYIHQIEIGFRSLASQPAASQNELLLASPDENSSSADIPSVGEDVPIEGLIFTGDENILNLDCVVHYKITDFYQYYYGVNPNSDFLRSIILSSIRKVFNRHDIMALLVNDRSALSREITDEANNLLQDLDVGIKLLQLNISNLHAPGNVHFYFRDVASSMEDKERVIHAAYKYALDTVIRSRGEGSQIINEAESYKMDVVSRSDGEATAFLEKYKAYSIDPGITRFRMYLEAIEESLKDVNAIFMLKFRFPKAAELWLNTNEKTVFLPYKEN